MLSVSGLRKEYGEVVAVADSSFEVADGEVFGVVGPNGAGKTTTLKTLAGLLEPTSGEVRVAGYDAKDPEMRRHLGWLPEESPLYEDMTAHSYLRFFADLYDVDRKTANERIASTLDRLELDQRERKLGNCSKGMKRKVAIARSLVNDPDVLVYDEPASGLDPLTTHEVIEFTGELAERGKTVVFSAHNLYHVEAVCDRIAIMNDGEIVSQGSLDEIRAAHGGTTYTVTADARVAGYDAEPVAEGYAYELDSMDDVEALRDALDGEILDIRTEESSLEDVFLSVARA